MYYYKVLNTEGRVNCLITYNQTPHVTDPLYVEITAEEHAALSAEFTEKGLLTEQLYRNEIVIDNIRIDWQNEIQSRVNDLISIFGPFDSDEITDSEALDIILGGETA